MKPGPRSLRALPFLALIALPTVLAGQAKAQAAGKARAPAAAAARSPLFPSTDPRVRVVEIAGSVPKPRPAAVLLPRDYETSGRRYPVLYLLHGLEGAYDNWLSRTNLLQYTADLPLIVVMPDAGDSWYVNSATDTTQKFLHYVAQDVVNYADTNFRTLPFAEARYIAGLSMGGYGAIMIGTRYPNQFSLAASFSGAVGMMTKDSDSPSVNAVLGPPGSPARDSADLPALLRATPIRGSMVSLPYYYLDCGTSDRLIQGTRDVAAILATRMIPYEYHEVHGIHNWEYWNRRLPEVLQLVAQHMATLGR